VEERISSLVHDFHRDGFVVVPGDHLCADLSDLVTEFGTECSADEPSAAFPFHSLMLNRLLFERNVATVIEAIFPGFCISFCGATALRKRGGTRQFDQALHLEYSSSTLLVPRDADDVRGVVVIRYLSDVQGPEQGPTAVVPRARSGAVDVLNTRSIKRDSDMAELYAVEQLVRARAGDALIFGFNTFHRGTEVAEGEERLSIASVYMPRHPSEEGRYPPSCFAMDQWPRVRDLIATLDPDQLVLLGFPPASDPYWSSETIAAVQKRYPGMGWSGAPTASRAGA
jgi:hypothetical protein